MAHEYKGKEIESITIKKAENGFTYGVYTAHKEQSSGQSYEYIYENVDDILKAVKDDLESSHVRTGTKSPLGEGTRFKQLTAKLEARGAKSPKALAAWIGRKKYGKERFQRIAAKARREE